VLDAVAALFFMEMGWGVVYHERPPRR
jgi:hypothetical protein